MTFLHRPWVRAVPLAVVLGLGLVACGDSDPASDAGGPDGSRRDGGTDAGPDASPLDGGIDATPVDFCATAEEGAECGERRVCEAGECVFTEPDLACDYDFGTTLAGAFLVIACDHDLGGAEVDLPADVTLAYNGGSIRNGRLNLNGGRIGGELLNIELTLGLRTDPGSLMEPSFAFRNERWQLVEGEVSDEVALANREHINVAIEQVSTLGGRTFTIGALDVFLDVHTGHPYDRTLLLPSDFHLAMGDETHLRVQPNDMWEYAIISTIETQNVRISGGHLWGDRYTHDYAGGGAHPQDQGLGVYILGGVGTVVENLSANQFIGDGLVVGVIARRNDDGSPQEGKQYSADITVRGCTFDENRRNGLALTDVAGIVIEDVTITRTALGDRDVDGRSAGVTPRQGIQIEPYQPAAGDGTLRILEEVTDVVIRNSRFEDNWGADINFFKCHRAEAYGNTFGSGVGMVASFEVTVHDNIFVADSDDRDRGITVRPVIRDDGRHFVRDWEIYNNHISGFATGIQVGGQDQRVHDNVIEDFTLRGIYLTGGVNNHFDDNTMTSTHVGSRGFAHFRGMTLSGGISGGTVTVEENPIHFNEFDGEVDGTGRFVIDGVDCTSSRGGPVSIVVSQHVTVRRCTADGYSERDNTDVVFEDNVTR